MSVSDQPAPMKPVVLLIDDSQEHVGELAEATTAKLGPEFEVRTWSPSGQEDALARFKSMTSQNAVLVATDYDLTGLARTGLYGSTIADWCRNKLIPVATYTQFEHSLSKETNQFEFRIPYESPQAALEVASIVRGFAEIAAKLAADADIAAISSPTAMLAILLGHPEASASFSLYATRSSSSNPALFDAVSLQHHPSPAVRARILTYVAGHLLYNSILKYPGPLMSCDALCAYLALPSSAAPEVGGLFENAKYAGPFNELSAHFWMERVDARLEEMARKNSVDYDEMSDTERRSTVEAELGRTLGRHGCGRCNGERGGYWCPFTQRPVCERKDCSVASSSLIPQGASLTRIERDFYDAWVPLLGL